MPTVPALADRPASSVMIVIDIGTWYSGFELCTSLAELPFSATATCCAQRLLVPSVHPPALCVQRGVVSESRSRSWLWGSRAEGTSSMRWVLAASNIAAPRLPRQSLLPSRFLKLLMKTPSDKKCGFKPARHHSYTNYSSARHFPSGSCLHCFCDEPPPALLRCAYCTDVPYTRGHQTRAKPGFKHGFITSYSFL